MQNCVKSLNKKVKSGLHRLPLWCRLLPLVEGQSRSEIARVFGVNPAHIYIEIDRLVVNGYVTKLKRKKTQRLV